MKSGDSKGQSTLTIVLLVLVIILMISLAVMAYFFLPNLKNKSASKNDENTVKEPTVSINITDSTTKEPEIETSLNTKETDDEKSTAASEGRRENQENTVPLEETNITENDESCSELDSSYILPFSGIRKLIPLDIKNFNLEELTLARNEIFARHGYVFKTPWIRSYFESKSWYKPAPGYDGSLNNIEDYNVGFIKKYENILKGEGTDNYSDVNNNYILPNSNKKKLTGYDINYLCLEGLILARNEIFARHGYVFKTPWIRQYFESKSWYVPNPGYQGNLNSIEDYNVHLIKEYEAILKSR